MLEIILVIVGTVIFVNLNSRIGDIERRLKNHKSHIEDIEEKLGGKKLSSTPPPQTVQESENKEIISEPDINLVPVQRESEMPLQSSSASSQRTDAPEEHPISVEEASGKWLGKIGIGALFLGVAFFLKYAFEHDWIDESLRVIIGLVIGIVLLGFGQRLRKTYDLYGQLLTGGGIAVLYLSVFGAYSFYNLISQPTAFVAMAVVTALSMVISVVDDAPAIAVLGILGGFATPLMLSTGVNNPVGLFGYLLILDIGVVIASLKKKWLRLNFLSLIGTALLYFLWYGEYYTFEQLFIAIVFATAFFLTFLTLSVMHNVVRREESSIEDLGFIGLTAAGYFLTLFTTLYEPYQKMLGFIAVAIGVLYAFVARYNYERNPEHKLLPAFLTSIAIIFLTIAIPIELDGIWIGFAWFAESVVLYYCANEFELKILKPFSYITYILGICNVLWANIEFYNPAPFTNKVFFLTIFGALCSYWIAYISFQSQSEQNKESVKKVVAAFIILANLMTLQTVTENISLYYANRATQERISINTQQVNDANYGEDSYDRSYQPYNNSTNSLYSAENTAISVFWALYAILLLAIGFMKRVKLFRLMGLALLFVTILKVFIEVWNLGELYRIISSIIIGVIALAASFAYTKYKDRLKHMITD